MTNAVRYLLMSRIRRQSKQLGGDIERKRRLGFGHEEDYRDLRNSGRERYTRERPYDSEPRRSREEYSDNRTPRRRYGNME